MGDRPGSPAPAEPREHAGRSIGSGKQAVKRSDLSGKTIAELRALARSRGHRGYSRLRKGDLVELLSGASTKATSGPARDRPSGRRAKPLASSANASKQTSSTPQRRASVDVAESALSPRTRRAFSSHRRLGEQRIKASKYYLGVQESPELDDGFDYPETHGESAISLMVRDPYWLFAYWEFAPGLRGELIRRIGEDALLRSRTVLRVHDVTGTDPDNALGHHDIDVAPEARNWYINVARVEREYCVDIGMITPDGLFIVIARSNRVSLPPVGPSELIDEEWVKIEALEDFYVRIASERGPSSGSGGWGSGGFGR